MRQVNFAKYIKVDPRSKKQSAQLTSSNSLVGNIFSLKADSKNSSVKIYNKFNYVVAEIKDKDAKDIILWINKDLRVLALLTYVAYNSIEDKHFAEFLVIVYPKTQENAYKNFIENISSKLANGSRPDITLDKFERNKIESNKGDYKIDKFLKKPELEKGCAIVKNKQGIMEKIIEAGRQRKIGCYIGSIIFLLLIIGLII